MGGLVVAGLLKLKGSALDTPSSDMVETTIHGLLSSLLKGASITILIRSLRPWD
jgi:hypothetical protein